MRNQELMDIIIKFSQSGWDLIGMPSEKWLSEDGESNSSLVVEKLTSAIEQADKECGSCGCEFDPLYKRALELLK